MNVNQTFNSTNFKHRVTNMNPILALIMVFAMTLVAITLLPFLLLFGLISFLTLRFLGKKMLRRQQAEQENAYQHYANVKREPAAPYADMFKRSGTGQAKTTGRTFEHQAD
jgi:ABC-type multidrug transport system fused ATPase/permease subunit